MNGTQQKLCGTGVKPAQQMLCGAKQIAVNYDFSCLLREKRILHSNVCALQIVEILHLLALLNHTVYFNGNFILITELLCLILVQF